MSPRPKLPDARENQYRLRMSDAETEKLDYCVEVLGLTKAQVIRQGIEEMYTKAQKQAKK